MIFVGWICLHFHWHHSHHRSSNNRYRWNELCLYHSRSRVFRFWWRSQNPRNVWDIVPDIDVNYWFSSYNIYVFHHRQTCNVYTKKKGRTGWHHLDALKGTNPQKYILLLSHCTKAIPSSLAHQYMSLRHSEQEEEAGSTLTLEKRPKPTKKPH